MAPVLIFAILSLLSFTRAEERSHGLDNESPVALSPEAYDFFHPNGRQPSTNYPCSSSNCSTLPLAATVRSTPAQESIGSAGKKGLGAGAAAGILLGFVLVCMTAMGAYYVVTKRQANLQRSKPEQLAEV